MKKPEIIIVALILVVAFSLRLYKLNNPIADWHSWRQADTAAVARNFTKDNFNILYPQSDSFTPLNEYGLENPNRYFINEFPLYNSIVTIFYKIFSVNPAIARLVSISFATFGTLFLYLLAKKLFDLKVALLATFFYATNPFNIYYGRVIMPDPAFVALSITSLYLFLKWTESKKPMFMISASSILSLAILTKPFAVFLFIPIFYWLFLNRKNIFKEKSVYLFTLMSLLPFALWRIHVFNHPEGTFATSWLFNAENIRFTGAFFRWLIFERLNRLIFATGAFVLFVIGIAKSHATKNGSFVFAWLISQVVYMVIFAKGNVNHDYYQLPLVAPGAILVALGFFALVNISRKPYSQAINIILALSLIIVSYAFGWYEIRGFFNINRPEIVEAGKRVDQLLPKDAIVIAPYSDDPSFLYQTNRHGYTALNRPIKYFLENGAGYLVSVDLSDPNTETLEKNCQVVEKGEKYVIIEINSQCTEM